MGEISNSFKINKRLNPDKKSAVRDQEKSDLNKYLIVEISTIIFRYC